MREGKRLREIGDIDLAMTVFDKVLSDSKTPIILNELACFYKEEQRFDKALVLARAALQLDPTNQDYQETLKEVQGAKE